MKFIDLFSGAGGLSEGFIQAGFEPVAHVEADAHACKTLQTRLIYHFLKKENKLDYYYSYLLGELDRKTLLAHSEEPELINSILNFTIGEDGNKPIFRSIENNLNISEVDLIIGGPPCQAYSLVGRSRDKNNMEGDSRNYLYLEYAKFLLRYTPKIFVFENVTGLLTADDGSYFEHMQSHFNEIGYNLNYAIQKSEDFGILQKRRRIILVGWQSDLDFEYPEIQNLKNTYCIRDIFTDLKPLSPGEQNNITKYEGEITEYLRHFNFRNGADFVTQHIARPHNDRDLEIYKIAIQKWLQSGQRLKYPELPDRLKTHKNENSFVDRFKVVDPNGFSHTIVAHIAKDGHYYIYPDTEQIRSISVREAARIQSFPDDYYFEGGRTAAFRQIGNAVPPLMAEAIAKSIKNWFLK